MFDIDHFKSINDEYGHLTGDFILKELAHVIKRRIRREEMFARYGGEEFCIVLPESDADSVLEFAGTVRKLIEGHVFEFEGSRINVTISIGIGHLSDKMKDPIELLKVADDRLYEAKRAGRNRVCA
jgi:two-component system cell cycle response regulator